jgi:hypothetical protein
LRIDGIATIIETETAAPVIDELFNNIILIKLTIVHAEYFQPKKVVKASLKEKISYFISDLFAQQSYKTFDFPKIA